MRSVVEVLKLDHRKVEALFEAVESADDGATRELVIHAIAFELGIHCYAEESIVYLKASSLEPLQVEAESACHDHGEIRESILLLERTDPDELSWMDQFKKLKHLVAHHVAREESEFLPNIEKLFTPTELQTMAREVLEAKEKLAKTADPKVRQARTLYSQVETERLRNWI